MRNYDEKIRDMSRSVLPSVGREKARKDRRAAHQRQRAREAAVLSAYRRADDPGEVTLDPRHPAFAAELKLMVSDRRQRDKTGPLVRWARATIAADPALAAAPREQQLAHFASLLPPTLIGRHAVMHIKWGLEADERRAAWQARCAERAERTDVTADRLRAILAAGAHRDLNVLLGRLAGTKTRWSAADIPRRPCYGTHDIAAFTAEMARFPEVRAVIESLARSCS